MKNNFKGIWLAAFLIAFASVTKTEGQNNFGVQKVGSQTDGSILVPTNQLLRPAGFQVYMPGRPVDLVEIPDRGLLAVKNKNSLELIRLSDRTILQSLPFPESGSSFKGIWYSEKNSAIYVTDAKDKVLIARLDKNNILNWQSPITMPVPSIGGS
ncbi:MAG: hypothetical protein RBS23_10315, partial [Mariniphaga sp.]|nr:hypothetical protein [Mariniphaga sp.]